MTKTIYETEIFKIEQVNEDPLTFSTSTENSSGVTEMKSLGFDMLFRDISILIDAFYSNIQNIQNNQEIGKEVRKKAEKTAFETLGHLVFFKNIILPTLVTSQ